MRTPELELDLGAVSGQSHEQMKWFTFGAVIFTHLLLVGSIWAQWGNIAIVTGTFVLVTGLNVVLAQRFFSKRTRTAEAIRLLVNLLSNLIYGHFSAWALPMWLYLPLNSLWVDSHLERWVRALFWGLLLLLGGAAVLDGCSPMVPLVFLCLSALVYVISNARATLQRHLMELLSNRHQALVAAYAELEIQRHREKDRLSSLGLLAAGLAHEINNPMSYVKSNVIALQRELEALREVPSELREYVTDVLPATRDGIDRVCTIVADLRRFARREPGQLVEYDLNKEVEAAIRMGRGALHSRCELEVELASLPPMRGMPQQMAQVVLNLLINAAQSIPEQGKIFLSTHPQGEEVVLTVRDTGQGMEPEIVAKLFQPFFTTKPVGEGTGLGLAVVHGIVSAHGGRIEVESQPGRGTTFTVRLPAAPPMRALADA